MRLAAIGFVGLVCTSVLAAEPVQRTLSFEERVKAQTAIERVYYSHQVGATKSFDAAVPKAVIEAKVRKYLEQSAALNFYWKTPVTDYSLQRELERMAQGTRMPERLQELYAALGNDAFLVKECLARATLVDRLTRNFYAFDPTIHSAARGQADALRLLLVTGELSASADQPNRRVTELVASESSDPPSLAAQPSRQRLTPDEFKERRAELPASTGQVSEVKETREAFAFSVILSDTVTELRVANYVVPKASWDSWWEIARATARGGSVAAVAAGNGELPRIEPGGDPCATNDTWDNGILGDLPEPRADHAAVWTGSQMIVWGGEGFNTGGRYDPATDSWASTSTLGAPTTTGGESVTWAGSVMIVWGGGYPTVNTGARYDPLTDTWAPTSTVGAPAPRGNHTAVWTGSRLIVWGGDRTLSGYYVNTGGRYDPSTDTWSATSIVDAPAPTAVHSAVWTGHVMIVWDGYLTGGRYDPDSDTWAAISTVGAPAFHVKSTAVWTGTEFIVWGGFDGFSSADNTGGRYDPVTDNWGTISTTGAPDPRYGHSAVWTGTKMLIWGGRISDYALVSQGGSYDPAADSWAPMSEAGAPNPRESHTAVWTGTAMVAWGGAEGGQFTRRVNTGGRYDPASDTWTPTSNAGAPSGRYLHTAIWSGTNMVVWGGRDGSGPFNTGGRYDPTTDAWSPTSIIGAPEARDAHVAVWTGREMVVWGGRSADSQLLVTGGRYDPTSDMWKATTTIAGLSGRLEATAIWTGSRMVIWGGGDSVWLNTGGRYDPDMDTWTKTSTIAAPQARESHTAVWTGTRMLIWGGYNGGYPTDGGLYDPENDAWISTSLTGAPFGRYAHTAVWTGTEMVVWGGYRASAPTNSGGSYDPATDTWRSTSLSAPLRRYYHTAIWTGHEMVVWGGYGGFATVAPEVGGSYNPLTDSWNAISTIGAPMRRAVHTAVWTGSSMIVWGGSYWSYHNSGGRYRPDLSPDADQDGYTICAGDCDDANPHIYPRAFDDCDGLDNDCDGIADNYGDAVCEDYNPCTTDVCTGTTGCLRTNNTNPCDDRRACTTGDVCGDGQCTGTPSSGNACDDGSACTSGDICTEGACHGAAIDCDDHNICTSDSCFSYYGCYYQPIAGVCDDGNACSAGDLCGGGSCIPGVARSCVDSNDCTDDSCDPVTGECVFSIDDTNSCSDGTLCTRSDTCHAGVCTGSNPVQCDQGCPPGSVPVGAYCQKSYDIDASLLFGLFWWCDGTGVDRYNNEYYIPYGFRWTDLGGSPAAVISVDLELGFGISCGGSQRFVHLNDATVGSFYPGYNCHCPPTRQTISLPGLDGANYALGGLNTISIGSSGQSEGLSKNSDLGDGFARVIVTYDPIGNACRVGSCVPSTGMCGFSPVSDGIACSDHNVCTTNDLCGGGDCIGGAELACDDHDVCTGDSCSPTAGCLFTPDTEMCDDQNPCTIDACDAIAGCNHTNNASPCSDGDACTSGDTCGGGACQPGPPASCNDGNTCTTDTCISPTGCVFINNTNPCDDGNACTTNDTCGTPVGSFLAENFDGVTVPLLPTGWTTSVQGSGSFWFTRAAAPDTAPNSAFAMESSRPADQMLTTPLIAISSPSARLTFRNRWSFEFFDSMCFDAGVLEIQIGDGAFEDIETAGGRFASGGYTGTAEPCCGNPVGGRSAWCDTSPGYPAYVTTEVELPDTVAGQAIRLRWRLGSDSYGVFVGQDIDSIVISDPTNTCNGEPAIDCDDFNPCSTDSCDPATGVCVHADNPSLCEDNNACTNDSCSPSVGCLHTSQAGPCDDGNACTTGDACAGGVCAGGSLLDCNDGNVCSNDSCNPVWGCVHVPADGPCDDGDACTSNDACGGGTCHGGLRDCNDNNPCTYDMCNTATGTCGHEAVNCSDGNPCNGAERCTLAGCAAGPPLDCDDQDPCTDDSCVPATGCVHSNNTSACDDADACTLADTCEGGACHGTAIVCNDNNVCTTDACIGLGICSFVSNTNACDDGNACTLDDRCAPPVGSTSPIENFDGVTAPSLPTGWTTNVVGTGHLWVTRATSGDEGPNSVFGPESELIADAVLDSPPIPVTSATARLTFRNRWSFDAPEACYDGGVLEIKIGAGSYLDIVAAGGTFASGGYTGTISADYRNPLASRAAWCLVSDGYPDYLTTAVDLPAAAAGQTIRLRWRLGSDSSVAVAGQDIDSIVITESATTCHGGPATDCDDNNPCTDDSCNPTTGCVHTNNSAACNDGNGCTLSDVCVDGTCVGSNPVVCSAADQCHSGGSCDPLTGACIAVNIPDGTTCDDNDLCTTGETCRSGACTPAFSGLNEPNPRTNGYYKSLCHGPHSGDGLTDADAVCVASVAHTFAGISTIADLCAELQPSKPNSDACDRTDDDLMVLALNICRARVCTAQGIDSECGGNTNVGQSLAESDAILGSSSRTAATCARAKCLDEEINTGGALELNSLTITREKGGIRLRWSPPYLNDGTAHPSRYHVWRRALGSILPFRNIAETTETTFVDVSSGAETFQYEITAVMH